MGLKTPPTLCTTEQPTGCICWLAVPRGHRIPSTPGESPRSLLPTCCGRTELAEAPLPAALQQSLPFVSLSHLPHLRLRSYWPWSGHPACTLTTSTALRRTFQGWRSGFHLPCLTSRQPAPESKTVTHTGHSKPSCSQRTQWGQLRARREHDTTPAGEDRAEIVKTAACVASVQTASQLGRNLDLYL